MQAARPFPNEGYRARQFYQSILRGGARFVLGAALTVGAAACTRIQHVDTAPVGAIADSVTGAERKSSAPAAVDIDKLINDLKHGGYVIVFRHAPTNRDQSDSDPLNYSDTTHQRLLSATGVELAKKVGYALLFLVLWPSNLQAGRAIVGLLGVHVALQPGYAGQDRLR